MVKLRSVCIIEKTEQEVPAVYLKEFFMFAGVYVCENVVDFSKIAEIKNRKSYDVDMYIDLTTDENDDELVNNSIVYIRLPISKNEELNSQSKRKKFGNAVFELIWDKLEQYMQNDEARGFRVLSDIFVNNDYAHRHYLSHLYLNQMSENEKSKLYDVYVKCFKDIYDEINKNLRSLNLHYAYLNCARKINRIDISCNRQTLFDEVKVMETAHNLVESDPSFTIADVLAGQIAFSRSSVWKEGIYYLKEALEREHTKKYISFVFYCIGHFYEVEQKDLNRAEKFYNYIKRFDSENYRMNFKIGWIHYCKSEYNEAISYFYKVYQQMQAKAKTKWIQPLEMEYWYKCALILSKSEMLKNTSAEQEPVAQNMVEDIKNKTFEDSNFVSNFLSSKEKKIYKQYFMRKMEEHSYSLIID